jgi:hypothetical protein
MGHGRNAIPMLFWLLCGLVGGAVVSGAIPRVENHSAHVWLAG